MDEELLGRVFYGWGGLIKEMCWRGQLCCCTGTDKRYLVPEVPVFIERDEARRILIRRYFSSFGPATTQDCSAFFLWRMAEIKPLLEEIPCRSYKDTSRRLPLWFWRFMAWLQRLLGLARQGETRRETAARADALLDRLAAEGGEAILIVPPRLLPVLLDRLRRRNCCAQRSGVLRYRPFERILISEREEHCGGCQHNCLLSDPGCGVGRDKAMRKGLPYKEK